jgi:acetolactate synthase I/II/III large subunit
VSEHAGHRLLRHLHRRGIDSLYFTAGSDFAPLVHAYAQGREGLPQPVACLDENVAIGMAHGRACASGRPQVAMVHVTVGTAKALCGLINAAHDRTPLVLLAGRNPVTQQGNPASRSMYIHWSQEMFDQGGMVREFVKWDYELRDASQVEEALDRALAIAMSEPRGPVYLTLPREVLAGTAPAYSEPARDLAIPASTAPDADTVARVASLVAAARCPVVVASDVGLHPGDREALARFTDDAVVGVVESNRALTSNLDVSHARHLGFDVAPALAQADLLIVCGAVAPWIPSLQGPRPGCRVVHVGPDPLFSRVPFRHFPADVLVASGYRQFFDALALELHVQQGDATAERSHNLGRLRDDWLKSAAAKREKAQQQSAITKASASVALQNAMPAQTVLVNEYWVDRDLAGTQGHGSYFYQSPAGGLGWGVPAALGVRAAQPQRHVVAAVGDGAYVFANPAACHHAASAHGLPILIAVYNNGRWGAVESSAQQVYPDLKTGPQPLPLSGFGDLPDFAAYARASGGHGETVSDAGELRPALERCFTAMESGRHALVNILGS